MTNFPNENSLALLREAGAVYIVIDKDWLTSRRLFQLEALQGQLSLDFAGEAKSIYQFVPVE